MPVEIQRWERYPSTDRNDLAAAALQVCRAIRAVEGVRSRFYWVNPNQIMFITEAATPEARDAIKVANFPTLAKAAFDVSDLASLTESYWAVEPNNGEQSFTAAGRTSQPA